MKLSKLFQPLLLISILINFPTNAGESRSGILGNSAKYLSVAGLAGAVSWVGYKFNQSKSDQAHDEQLKRKLENVGAQDFIEEIGKRALEKFDFQLLALQDREKLLAAVIPDIEAIQNLREYFQFCSRRLLNYWRNNSPEAKAEFSIDGPFALSFAEVHREENGYQRKKQLIDFFETRHVKNQIGQSQIIGRNLLAGEFALIGFSDGDIQIHLNNSDRRALNNLSLEQREFIKGLYGREGEEISLSFYQWKIFRSLPWSMQNCLKKHYNLTTWHIPLHISVISIDAYLLANMFILYKDDGILPHPGLVSSLIGSICLFWYTLVRPG